MALTERVGGWLLKGGTLTKSFVQDGSCQYLSTSVGGGTS
ncbi:hypothetical protein ABIC85_004014, partial [Oerskovia enterophila]